jgi:ankyrin repeat protein
MEADCKDANGWTPLSWAAGNGSWASNKGRPESEKGREGVARLLDRDDVNANSTNESGISPLIYSARFGREEIAKHFLERQDVDADSAKNLHGPAPSDAARHGHIEVVRPPLLRKG